MIRIGLFSESKYDNQAIANLLNQKYSSKAIFKSLSNKIEGYHLTNPNAKRILKLEFENKNCDYVVFMKDVDGLRTEVSKIKNCNDWFKIMNEIIDAKGIFLMNIWELEALILADIETFNKIYKTKIKFTSDPSMHTDPKRTLKEKTSKTQRKYKESDTPEIFEKLNINAIAKNCPYFKDFLIEFDIKIKI